MIGIFFLWVLHSLLLFSYVLGFSKISFVQTFPTPLSPPFSIHPCLVSNWLTTVREVRVPICNYCLTYTLTLSLVFLHSPLPCCLPVNLVSLIPLLTLHWVFKPQDRHLTRRRGSRQTGTRRGENRYCYRVRWKILARCSYHSNYMGESILII